MECQNCELKQRQFYCENCLRQQCVRRHTSTFYTNRHSSGLARILLSLLSYRLQTQHAATDRDAHIASAQKALKTIVDPARLMRAGLKGREERRQEVWDGVYQLRPTNDHRECLRVHVERMKMACSLSSETKPSQPKTL